ncbi:iron-sulfur cluster carrier protein ApbC [Leucothrix arctica]|uniref:Iron-sulfur cluster carrier protein n=1 Tax=Leucothrix arctica TaxID=1481894 RepID=A0A317C5Y5_9GAMM|nr:iron-sulfur cluster carrier protein ApbC [Leucothrix arctica]PWQ94014.1 iron-sulfur cluster carrier protein ApbC [Leucothrix arctica]
MSELSKETIENTLKIINDKYQGNDIVSSGAVKSIEIDAGKASVTVELGYAAGEYANALKSEIEGLLSSTADVISSEVTVNQNIVAHAVQKSLKRIEGIKNIIAIASGKGGVGKSTTAANLALALSADGAKVGVLDADIYGPSQPRMLGMSGTPESKDGSTLEPMENFGIKAMSIGFLVEEDTPMIWRGPMVTQALEQMLRDTNWGDLDYLIVDLPPGTGDAQLTLSQKIPVSGAVIVTTPQDIALLDARKGLAMFEKVAVPVLGIVENMSIHICTECGHAEHIFGEGGGERMSKDFDVDFLGSLPLDINIRQQADDGKPSVISDPDGKISEMYHDISRTMAAKLAEKSKDYSNKFPNIVIHKS